MNGQGRKGKGRNAERPGRYAVIHHTMRPRLVGLFDTLDEAREAAIRYGDRNRMFLVTINREVA